MHLVGDPALLVGALGEVRPTRFFGVPRVWEKIQTGIGGLLAEETDAPRSKVAVEGAMAVGLEYVESLQAGHETSPELQAAVRRGRRRRARARSGRCSASTG